ncbi:MAG: hypothetical protein JF606_08370 [Burkholderiales bacterium]|nr:hypothetical protein [Burkholderiales bacterium]
MPAAPQEANLDGLLAALERSARPPGPQVRGPRRRRARGMEGTPRSSSMLENLNSRLRRYFFLRRHLGNAYLSLLQFFLNHRVFMRSRRADRVGKMPKQLLTGPSPCALARAAGIRASLAGLTSAPKDAPQVLLNPSTMHARPPRLATASWCFTARLLARYADCSWRCGT